ncbi:MAG TPA: hypothetical protein VGB45_07685 [Abditibacterium sp.]|jgi:hypothetical protein
MPAEILITPIGRNDYYPRSCVTDEQKREWSTRQIESGIPLPPPHRLPEGSELQAESIRRSQLANQ